MKSFIIWQFFIFHKSIAWRQGSDVWSFLFNTFINTVFIKNKSLNKVISTWKEQVKYIQLWKILLYLCVCCTAHLKLLEIISCISEFSSVAIKHHAKRQFKEERIYFGLWFQRRKHPQWLSRDGNKWFKLSPKKLVPLQHGCTT